MPSAEASRDTIAAIATPAGRGGIGVVRVSGPLAPQIAVALAGALPVPRFATHARFKDAHGEVLDDGVALYFPAPHSYTGEAVLELQGHGGPVVMGSLLQACVDCGARIAEPGEFTRRAFLEGKLDLAQAEAVADLIDAASREAARSALRSLSGEFSALIGELATQLVEVRALIEAMLDFPEEELDALQRHDLAAHLARLRCGLDGLLVRSRRGNLLRRGVYVVLAGRPNVGKSSILNRLAGEERAIVTPIAGTTRDALREPIELEGVPMVVVDTAGLRAAADVVERLGIERTQQELARADVVLAIYEAGGAGDLAGLPQAAARIDVFNKTDLVPGFVAPEGAVGVSARTGAGIDALGKRILEAAGWSATGEDAFLARERHLRGLEAARQHVAAASGEVARWELAAEELRLAQRALGGIVGEFSADDLLGEIFSRFCIGK